MQTLIDAVQYNCDIADARHGGDYGMCTYLLKMRELYRWQHGLSFGAPLGKDAVGDWLTAREERLEGLEDADFRDLVIDDKPLDPFDAEAVNAALQGTGLVYSAGLVNGARPHFFLGELETERCAEDGFVLRVSGRELARCLNAPPAMTRGSTIFLRRESLRRYLWEKYESWLWNRPDGAMARVVACYPFEEALDEALDRMTEAEMAVVAAHERGEFDVGLALGEDWDRMLLDVSLTPAEIMARAVRDHLADCLHTLPMLIESGRESSLHFFFANLGAMRKELFPSLERGYRAWLDTGDTAQLEELADRGRAHWHDVAHRMMSLHREMSSKAAAPMAAEVQAASL
jgi:hypothetical protein